MDDTYRISETSLRRYRWSMAAVPAAALLVCLWQFRSESDVAIAVLIVAAVVTTATVIAFRQNKRYSSFAQYHSLELRNDALLLKDSGVETRIPHSSILLMTVMGSMESPRAVILKLVDGTKCTLNGYADMPRIVDQISQRLDSSKLQVRRWVHV